MSSGKWLHFCLGINVISLMIWYPINLCTTLHFKLTPGTMNDNITWQRFRVDSFLKGPVAHSCDVFFLCVCMKERLNTPWNRTWFETPWRSHDVILMEKRTPCSNVNIFTSYNTHTRAYNILHSQRRWDDIDYLFRFLAGLCRRDIQLVAQALSISIQVVFTKLNVTFLVHTIHLFKGHG